MQKKSMMNKLLDSLSGVWNKVPKEFDALVLGQNSGVYPLVTIDIQSLTLHSMTFRSTLPLKQVLPLDNYTLTDLVTALNSLGYSASLTPESITRGYGLRKASVLVASENTSIVAGATLTAFTSPLWQLLYPISRLLEELDNDTEKATEQMYAELISGKWVDYWATFFSLKRKSSESDYEFQKRIFISLFSMKTNNVALQELLKYTTNGTASVRDSMPAQFEVLIDPKVMDTVSSVHEIIRDAKGAGIDYFLNYKGYLEEQYQSYFKDANGVEFTKSDKQSVSSTYTPIEHTYGYENDRALTAQFRTNRTKILTGGLKIIPKRLNDLCTVILALNEAKFTTPLEGVAPNVQMQMQEQYLKPTEILARQVELSERYALAEVVQESSGATLSISVNEDPFITPLDSVASSVQMQEQYPTPTESLTSREVSLSDRYIDPTTVSLWGLRGFRTNYSRAFSPTDALAKARISILDERVQETLGMDITFTLSESKFTTPSEELSFNVQMQNQDQYSAPVEALISRQVELADRYIDPAIKGLWGFRTNYSRAFSPTDALAKARISILDERVQETLGMTLTVAGNVVKSM